jgi:hypothetical protein
VGLQDDWAANESQFEFIPEAREVAMMSPSRIIAMSTITTLFGAFALVAQPVPRDQQEGCENHGYAFTSGDSCRSSWELIDYCSIVLTAHFGMSCTAHSASYCTGNGEYQCSTQYA